MWEGMDDAELRYEIYRSFAATGDQPPPAKLVQWMGSREAVAAALRRLHAAHALVLDGAGAIRMALPFSAVETGHAVLAEDQRWRANCAWDTLAIPAALQIDAAIEASWLDTGEPVELGVRGGELAHTAGFIHFEIAARHWWDDIAET